MDNLCNPHGDWTTIDFVMSDWERTNSPLVYWNNEISERNIGRRYMDLKLDDLTLNKHANISYGLPTEETIRVCKDKYK